MARDRDSDEAVSNQSKRPVINRLDSDSQVSDHAHYHPSQHAQPRTKTQKHVVGGATGGRLHARVPSSKALHRHHSSTTASKLTRRQSSPSPDRGAGPSNTSNHRRALSDLKVARDTSSTNLRKNSSHTTLARNKSSSDFGRKVKSATQMRRSTSSPMVNKLRMAGNNKVHFNIGDDEEEDPEDGWVDASASASPLLSRRASTISGGGQSAVHPSSSATNSRPQSPRPNASAAVMPPSGNTNARASPSHPDRDTASNLTSRILQRTASYGAPPQMSKMTAEARPPSLRQHSPDSARSQGDTSSTLSGTPQTREAVRPPSRSREHLARYSGDTSQGSSGGPGGSYFPDMRNGGLMRAPNGSAGADHALRPRSMRELSQVRNEHMVETAQEDLNEMDEDEAYPRGIVAGARRRHNRGDSANPRNTNRTQQRLDLERASSTIETNRPHLHPGLGMGLAGVAAAAGPLVGGSGYDSRDPRIAQLLERTGTEYLVVRRYQNPIARSLNRLAQLPGANKHRCIPRPGTSQSSRASTFGYGVDMREYRDPRDARDPNIPPTGVPHHMRRPSTPGRSYSITRANGGFALGPDVDDDPRRMHEGQGLSGASLVEREEDTDTAGLLRNLWDKNLDLSASQD